MNDQLHHGDNLPIMQGMAAGSVDLIYADPPFGTGKDWGAYADKRTGDDYLAWIEPRLIETRRLLKPTGSIYLHCDPTMSHYLKVLMDAVFGRAQFRNEIIWLYRRWPRVSTAWQTMHDVILFYTRSLKNTFNVSYEPISESTVKRFKGKTQVLDPVSRTRNLVVDKPTKGLPMRDVWSLSIIAGSAAERTGYPTQKPLALLERIISASSNPGDVVLDPFCGSGTALVSAERAGRRWIGIDASLDAIRIAGERMSA